eukprot:gnl/TRDRNA2_/TRDRNA2_146340_c0_seq1.p1 gnl/TRDRNA2_/TRDRNA2_146340_c0~~gnl/TRDRNA2_/TRDRNA2_146340_c0_seq1.p1  ORF type:complete len:346 (-),score=107.05 gnl/TRDRNA2_/TRDRNA2_146340_c0_seq1:45-1082(-)
MAIGTSEASTSSYDHLSLLKLQERHEQLTEEIVVAKAAMTAAMENEEFDEAKELKLRRITLEAERDRIKASLRAQDLTLQEDTASVTSQSSKSRASTHELIQAKEEALVAKKEVVKSRKEMKELLQKKQALESELQELKTQQLQDAAAKKLQLMEGWQEKAEDLSSQMANLLETDAQRENKVAALEAAMAQRVADLEAKWEARMAAHIAALQASQAEEMKHREAKMAQEMKQRESKIAADVKAVQAAQTRDMSSLQASQLKDKAHHMLEIANLKAALEAKGVDMRSMPPMPTLLTEKRKYNKPDRQCYPLCLCRNTMQGPDGTLTCMCVNPASNKDQSIRSAVLA